MILGIALILLAAWLNAIVLLIPLIPFSMFTWWAVDLCQKLHWMRRSGAVLAGLGLILFGLLLAACFQMWIWGLAPHAEPGRWTMAVAAYALGQAVVLVGTYKSATSQMTRRFASWKAAFESSAFAFLFLLAFLIPSIHAFLAVFPVRLIRFIVGGGT